MKRGVPGAMMMARGAKTKIEARGLRVRKVARKANDGRIWPEAINGQGIVIWPKFHRAPEGSKLAIKIWCSQLAPTCSQVGIAATPMEEGHSLWL
ncbi:hypothetical protein O181_122816 [Austropuccinia psidii MF-1]|uniref:Uncharacterized protein n=1 Tax=Austropuccinia psidii MF-1 TaxID=1389203 RepID=A0A9Q3Q2Q8_9BASI|nr:hypothetical protein [Austropuccinia psidii MF-1]